MSFIVITMMKTMMIMIPILEVRFSEFCPCRMCSRWRRRPTAGTWRLGTCSC